MTSSFWQCSDSQLSLLFYHVVSLCVVLKCIWLSLSCSVSVSVFLQAGEFVWGLLCKSACRRSLSAQKMKLSFLLSSPVVNTLPVSLFKPLLALLWFCLLFAVSCLGGNAASQISGRLHSPLRPILMTGNTKRTKNREQSAATETCCWLLRTWNQCSGVIYRSYILLNTWIIWKQSCPKIKLKCGEQQKVQNSTVILLILIFLLILFFCMFDFDVALLFHKKYDKRRNLVRWHFLILCFSPEMVNRKEKRNTSVSVNLIQSSETKHRAVRVFHIL